MLRNIFVNLSLKSDGSQMLTWFWVFRWCTQWPSSNENALCLYKIIIKAFCRHCNTLLKSGACWQICETSLWVKMMCARLRFLKFTFHFTTEMEKWVCVVLTVHQCPCWRGWAFRDCCWPPARDVNLSSWLWTTSCASASTRSQSVTALIQAGGELCDTKFNWRTVAYSCYLLAKSAVVDSVNMTESLTAALLF